MKKQLILIGIGAFIIATLNGITYLSGVFLRDLQIGLNHNPIVNFWTTELSLFLIFTLLGIGAIKGFVRKSDYSERELQKFFILWVVGFLVVQLVQSLYGFFATDFIVKNHFAEFKNYTNFLLGENDLKLYQPAFVIMRYLIFALIIYIGQKTAASGA